MQENNLNTNKKVLLSGVQASGKLHFGNYFSVIKQNIDLNNSGDYESYIFIADYHALTTVKNKEALSTATKEIVSAYVACGLDLTKANLFKQSDIVEHAELCVILTNIVTVPYLMRAHAFKDHEAKNKEVNVGLFNYPVLMAADILIYNADIVPVGSDQKQHVEYARDIAGFYNRAWGVNRFKLPNDFILKDVATVPGIDGEKMSKSKGNVVALFGKEEEVKKSIMSIVTDSAKPEDKKNPDENNIYKIHKLFLNEEENKILRGKFENANAENLYGYAEAKKDLVNTVMEWRKGKYEKYLELINDEEKIREILNTGAKKAKNKAQEMMKKVRVDTGLDF